MPLLAAGDGEFQVDEAVAVAGGAIASLLAGVPDARVRVTVACATADTAARLKALVSDPRFRAATGPPAGDSTFLVCEATWRMRFTRDSSRALAPAAGIVEAAAREQHTTGIAGGAYVVTPPAGSVVADRGVSAIVRGSLCFPVQGLTCRQIVAVAPNMNPLRPDSLGGDYERGRALLHETYKNVFLCIFDLCHIGVAATEAASASVAPAAAAAAVAAPAAAPAWSPGKAGGWQDALTNIVRHPDKYASEIVHRDAETIVVNDKYPKARHHLLVMPARVVPSLAALTRADVPMLDALLKRGRALIDECVPGCVVCVVCRLSS
jgi:hypothetical protein